MQTYDVVSHEGRTEFRPTHAFAAFMIGFFFMGSGFIGYLAVRVLETTIGEWPGLVVGGGFMLGALFLVVMAAWAWRTRRTPLVIERGGEITYGSRRLCAASEVRCVGIVPSRGGEAGQCDVVLELVDGQPVSIPSQYFGFYGSETHAKPFADQLAQALAVVVRIGT